MKYLHPWYQEKTTYSSVDYHMMVFEREYFEAFLNK